MQQRYRYYFPVGKRTIRVCTPRVRISTEVREGKEWTRFGPALPLYKIMCEWVVQNHLRKRGSGSAPDLELLWPLHYDRFAGLSRGAQILRDEAGKWYWPHATSESLGKWGKRLLRGEGGPKLDDYKAWYELVRAVDPFHTIGKRAAREKLAATLYVPIDLRFSIQEQMEEMKPHLRDVQNYLMRSCGRKEVYRPDPEIIRRDAYCHVLNTEFGLRAPDIARIVFPEEGPGKAAGKVRKILSEFRAHLQRVTNQGQA